MPINLNIVMKKEYDSINVDLYIVAIAYGKNYSGNIYGRILISNNKFAKGSKYSRPINYSEIYYKEGVLENAVYVNQILSGPDIPTYRKVIALEYPLYWGKGNLIHISHAPVGIKNNYGTVTKIYDSYTASLNHENEEWVVDDELYDLFNKPGALYYMKKEYKNDYNSYISCSFEEWQEFLRKGSK